MTQQVDTKNSSLKNVGVKNEPEILLASLISSLLNQYLMQYLSYTTSHCLTKTPTRFGARFRHLQEYHFNS